MCQPISSGSWHVKATTATLPLRDGSLASLYLMGTILSGALVKGISDQAKFLFTEER
jgi:hypothetical protein